MIQLEILKTFFFRLRSIGEMLPRTLLWMGDPHCILHDTEKNFTAGAGKSHIFCEIQIARVFFLILCINLSILGFRKQCTPVK